MSFKRGKTSLSGRKSNLVPHHFSFLLQVLAESAGLSALFPWDSSLVFF